MLPAELHTWLSKRKDESNRKGLFDGVLPIDRLLEMECCTSNARAGDEVICTNVKKATIHFGQFTRCEKHPPMHRSRHGAGDCALSLQSSRCV